MITASQLNQQLEALKQGEHIIVRFDDIAGLGPYFRLSRKSYVDGMIDMYSINHPSVTLLTKKFEWYIEIKRLT